MTDAVARVTDALDSDEASIPLLARQLVDDGKDFVRAEIALYRARFSARLGNARTAAILAVVAIALAQGILVAGLVGLVLVLSAIVGAGWATVIVVLGGLAIVAILALVAVRLLRKAIEGGKETTE